MIWLLRISWIFSPYKEIKNITIIYETMKTSTYQELELHCLKKIMYSLSHPALEHIRLGSQKFTIPTIF